MKWIQSLTTISLMITFSVILSACSTMEGMGKDIQVLGKSIEKSAAPAPSVDLKPVEQSLPQPTGAVVTPVK